MRAIDLTHTIAPGMPVYPGTEPPVLSPGSTYARDGFRETRLILFSHTGTHMDAPAHLFPDRTALDALPASQFCGSALVVDCTDAPEGGRIGLERIARQREQADRADFLLLRTGWDARWGTPAYFGEYPVITEEFADYLLATRKKGVGLDVIGIDPIADANLSLHRRLLSQADFVIIENLCNLGACGEGLFSFFALPLKFADSDGAPVRALALLPEES